MHDKTAECAQALTDYKRLLREMSVIEHTLGRALDAISADRSNIRSGNAQIVPSKTRSTLAASPWPTPEAIEALLGAIRAEKFIAQRAWQQAPANERARLDFPISWHPEDNVVAMSPRPAVRPVADAHRQATMAG